jgi:hypothetical protein
METQKKHRVCIKNTETLSAKLIREIPKNI